MKIILEDSAYVQREDIFYLRSQKFNIPDSILDKLFQPNQNSMGRNERFEFIKFTNPKEIDFLKACDFIPDYMEMKKLSLKEIVKIFEKCHNTRKEKAKYYNSLTSKEKTCNSHIVFECKYLKVKMVLLKDVILYKQGKTTLNIPDEVRSIEEDKYRTIKKMIKSIFKKNK